mgnify:CR=1 FL=1
MSRLCTVKRRQAPCGVSAAGALRCAAVRVLPRQYCVAQAHAARAGNRKAAQLPAFSVSALLDGSWQSGFARCMQDQIFPA